MCKKFLRVGRKLYAFFPNLGQDVPGQVFGQTPKVFGVDESFTKSLCVKSFYVFYENFVHFTPTWAKMFPTKFLEKRIKFLVYMKVLEKVYV